MGKCEQKAETKRPKYVAVNRQQMAWLATDVDALVGPEHPVRAIWHLVSQWDLSSWEQEIRTREGEVGRPCWEPRLLVSVWVYGYSQGIWSARELERQMSQDRGLQWLAGTEVINAHTLSDFRMTHKSKLNQLMRQLLALLDEEQLIELDTIVQDGTKVGASASRQSLHRRSTLQQRLEKAREVVAELDRKAEDDKSEGHPESRPQAARRRAAQDKLRRLEEALRELGRRQAEGSAHAAEPELRVSDSDPQCRKMKQPDGGWAPSYNVQISTETKNRIIVGMRVSQAANDTQELIGNLNLVQHLSPRPPVRVLADNGYATRANVEYLAQRRIELVAPWKTEQSRQAGPARQQERQAAFAPEKFVLAPEGQLLTCPEGKTLNWQKKYQHHGQWKELYVARREDCQECPQREPCCGLQQPPRRVSRIVESAAMQAYLERMQKAETQTLYKRRKEVGEFPQMWMKQLWGWRRFSVRGLVKVGREALWAALAYNIQQWIRLSWKPRFA